MKFLAGWQQVAIMFFGISMASGLVNYSYSIIAVPIGQEFGANRTTMMLGVTGMTLAAALAGPLFGTFMDRRSIRIVMISGAFTLGIGFLALSIVGAMWQVIAIYTLLMAPTILAFGPVTMPALLTRWFVKRRGLALGIAAMGYSVGGFIIPPILTNLIKVYHWREAVQIAGGFVILCLVPAVFLMVINRPSDRNLNPDGDVHAAAAQQPVARHGGAGFDLALLANLNFWCIALAVGVPLAGASALLSNVLPFTNDHGFRPEVAAQILSTFAVFSLGGKVTFAALGDRVDLRALLAVSGALGLLAFLAFANAGNLTIVFVGSALFAFGLAIAVPLWGALVARVFGNEGLGAVMGTMSVFVTLLSVISPALFGFIRDKSGSYTGAYLLSAALTALALLMLSLIRYTRKPDAGASDTAATKAVA